MDCKERRTKLKKIFTDEFMKAHTKFHDFESFLKECKVKSMDDIDKHFEKHDDLVKKHTKFDSWKQMVEKAMNEEIQNSGNDVFFD